MKSLIKEWNGIGVFSSYEPITESWFFIALHSDRLGRPTGGTRMKQYQTPEKGLEDALRLAKGMTYKWASIDLSFGGGKAVIALSRKLSPQERSSLLVQYGQFLAKLKGSFATGEDLGTSPEDMLLIASQCDFVHGVDKTTNTAKDPGPYTARGVFVGIQTMIEEIFATSSFAGKSILIEGVGRVGYPLAKLLRNAGADLLLCDLDENRAQTIAKELQGSYIPLEHAYETPCDVYAPCAIGATLDEHSIAKLQCRIVAGSANNQLKTEEDANRLHEKGIWYTPDYLINAGGAMAFGSTIQKGIVNEKEILHRVDKIALILKEVMKEAVASNELPLTVVKRRAENTLKSSTG